MKWISVIPIRAGSKGIKNKNIQPVFDKPLYKYSIDSAIEAGATKIFISTDIREVIATSFDKKIVVEERPKDLCRDDTPMSDVMLNFLTIGAGANIKEDDIIVLMQATSPLRKKKTIIDALQKFSGSEDLELMMAVTETSNSPLKYGFLNNSRFENISKPEYCFSNRQSLPRLFRPTGSFYIFRAGWYRKNKSFNTISTGAYEIPQNQSIDIDSTNDIKKFEQILRTERRKNVENW